MHSAEHAAFEGGGALGRRMAAHDWAASPVGPVAGWPAALLTLVGVMLGSKQPMFTMWGPALTLLYNDAYRAILGHKDRDALGRSFLDVWAEAEGDLRPLVERAFAGQAVHMDDITLIVEREGLHPEAHFAFSYTPVRGAGGAVEGVFCACSETTAFVLAGRRQAFRLALEEALRGEDNADAVLGAAVRLLARHLGATAVGYVEVGEDGHGATMRAADGLPAGALPDLASLGAEAVRSLKAGRTVTASLPAGGDGGDAATVVVAAPVMRAGRLAAVLLAAQAEGRGWAPEEVGLIEATAARVADAAQRARAEAEARASEARFRTLTEALPNQVWTASPAGLIDWVNARARRYVGETGDEPDGLRWEAVVHPEDLPVAAERWAASLATGAVYEVEFRIRRADGEYRWHLVRAHPERGAAGTVARWIGTNTDIDDQKRAELDLAAAKAAAEEANRAKSTFIANMSHELRTPLSAIIGYAEMMAEEIADGCPPADVAADVAKVEGNARHLLGLINDVLDLSKIESGKMELYAEDFAVEPVLRELATTVEGLVDRKGNRLVLDLDPGLGAAHTDLTKLRQVLLNLLSNAAKFTEGGTLTLRAERRAGPPGQDTLVFTVRDTGIGMNAEQQARLFQRFTQADSSTTRKFGGTGLGLSLVKAFAQMLGGDVAVESSEGQGSAFSVSIGATLPAQPGDEALPDPEVAPDGVADGRDLVLVVDDDADQRALVTRFLHREGFRVQVTGDGRTGLALARKLRPRAILLDVMMPGIDGWSVLTALKQDAELAAIPVVMVTSVDQRSLAASLGAADYMLKPVRWDRFAQVMNRFRTPQGDILLVDDDLASRTGVATMLERDGWTVTEAGDGREGLEQAAAKRPDVVLLDLSMPVMDGFDFLRELRALPGCAEVPVVVLTGRDLTRDDRQRLRGVSQILNKGDAGLRTLVERLARMAEEPAARPAP